MPHALVATRHIDAETVIERSRFLARVVTVHTESEALDVVAAVSAEFPDAGHHCWAFVVGADQEHRRQRASDDGEPGGTAGVPMLGVLTGRDLVDVVAVVSRWFGGVKLGAGGLVRAYSGAVSAALDRAEVGELARVDVLEMDLSHADAGRVEGVLRVHGFAVDDVAYGSDVRLRVIGDGDRLDGVLASATGGGVVAERVGHRWVLGL
ncbi:IMPACT family protein [Rhodococcus sp. NBC_00294]|uniref:IMPACT family protein n=1 Tax=Rhodococcus sp. NBC_00294 TaxID=2976004 RepID=UPI002E2E23D1|nr:YigZ family protein [Rhodococcus sp. NBC_00294]